MAHFFHAPTVYALGAIASAAAFTGIGLHMTFTDNVVRQEVAPATAVESFRLIYDRVKNMQIGFILSTSVLGGIAAYFASGLARRVFVAGSVLTTLVMPYTVVTLLKINQQIIDTDAAKADASTMALIKTWGERNVPRPLMTFTSVLLFGFGILHL